MRRSTSLGRAHDAADSAGAAVIDYARAAGPPLREAERELGVIFADADGAADDLGVGQHEPAPMGLGLGLDSVYAGDVLWTPTPHQLVARLAGRVADVGSAGYRVVGAYVGKHYAPRFGGHGYLARELDRRARTGGDVSAPVAPRLRTVPGSILTYPGHVWGRLSQWQRLARRGADAGYHLAFELAAFPTEDAALDAERALQQALPPGVASDTAFSWTPGKRGHHPSDHYFVYALLRVA